MGPQSRITRGNTVRLTLVNVAMRMSVDESPQQFLTLALARPSAVTIWRRYGRYCLPSRVSETPCLPRLDNRGTQPAFERFDGLAHRAFVYSPARRFPSPFRLPHRQPYIQSDIAMSSCLHIDI